MSPWFLLLLAFVIPFVCYYVIAPFIPPIRYVWGVLMIVLVSVLVSIFFFGGWSIKGVPSPDIIANIRMLWQSFLADIQGLKMQIDTGEYNWETWYWHGVFLVNTIITTVWTIAIAIIRSRNEEGSFFLWAYFGAVLSWIGLLVCELILLAIICIIVLICRIMAEGMLAGVALFILCIFCAFMGTGGFILILKIE